MPRVDGWEVLDFMRRAKVETRVVVLSGETGQHFSPVDRETITAVLHKPLDAASVRRVIRAADGATAPDIDTAARTATPRDCRPARSRP